MWTVVTHASVFMLFLLPLSLNCVKVGQTEKTVNSTIVPEKNVLYLWNNVEVSLVYPDPTSLSPPRSFPTPE